MKKTFITQLPIPACVVGSNGLITKANGFMKNVIVYEDIIGANFFALTGVKRETLLTANSSEVIIERNNRVFKIWTNDDPKENEDIAVLFDETTIRESFRSKLEADRAVIIYINIDNYDDLVASTSDDGKRAIPSMIDSIVRKWGASFDSPVISTDDDKYIMYSNYGKLNKMIQSKFSVLDEVRKIEAKIDFPASISIGAGISEKSLIETTEMAGEALELALGRATEERPASSPML